MGNRSSKLRFTGGIVSIVLGCVWIASGILDIIRSVKEF